MNNFLKYMLLLLPIILFASTKSTLHRDTILLNTQSIHLTKKEKAWISSHLVTVGVEQWDPVIFSNSGDDVDGIAGDYLKIIIKKTGLNIKIINKKWKDLLSDFKKGTIDLLPATYYTDQRDEYGLYSSGYFKMKDYIYVKESNKDIKTLHDLNGKKLAIEDSYGTIQKIKAKFPDIQLVYTKDLDDSINKVLNGEVSALYEGQIVIEKKIEDELIKGLKGVAQNTFTAPTLHFFSSKNEPILAAILQKGLNSISQEEHDAIFNHWIKREHLEEVDYSLLYKIGIFLLIVFLLIVLWNMNLKRVINEKTSQLQDLLNEQNKQLKAIEKANKLLTGRENKMIELKKEVNAYAQRLGEEIPYKTFTDIQKESHVDVEENIQLKDIMDIAKVQLLMENFYLFMNIPLAIIDLKGDVLVQSKWSRACTDFHRANEASCKRCIESDVSISAKLGEGAKFSQYKCKNGLIDCASPIIVNGKHVANFFIGQFLTEEPDIEFFKKQAEFFSYDVEDYIKSIKEAVIISEDKLPSILNFLTEVTQMLSSLSSEKLNSQRQEAQMRKATLASFNLAEDAQKAKEEIENYKQHLEDLVKERTDELNSQKSFIQTLLDSQEQLIITTDGKDILTANKTFLDFYSIDTLEQFKEKYNTNCICETFDIDSPDGYLQTNINNMSWIDYVLTHTNSTHKARIIQDSKAYIFSVTASVLPMKNSLKVVVFTDISEIENSKKELELSDYVIKNAPTEIYYIGLDGKILFSNKKAQRSLGYSAEELQKLSLKDINPTINKDSLKDIFDGLESSEDGTFYIESLQHKKDKSEYPVSISMVHINFENSEYLINYVQDISSAKQRESKLNSLYKHTQDSIEYASLIQGALIPEPDIFGNYFNDFFSVWRPKDIVGGDIYLFEELRDKDECMLMVIDCTGHGVPGAFVTMLVKAIERQIVANIKNSEDIVSPSKILSIFNKSMKHLLKQDVADSVSNAGFDGAILYYNKKEKIIRFSGAELPLFYVNENGVNTIKGSRHSVGYKKCDAKYIYEEHTVDVKEGMKFYLATDGYFDQNGGKKGFPFGKKVFKSIILKHQDKDMKIQKEILLDNLKEYQGKEEVNDDITLIGLEI
jgi:PAS domain S-box-containing protein